MLCFLVIARPVHTTPNDLNNKATLAAYTLWMRMIKQNFLNSSVEPIGIVMIANNVSAQSGSHIKLVCICFSPSKSS